MPRERVTINLTAARALLEQALHVVDDLDGMEVDKDPDLGDERRNKQYLAEVSRDLMFASELSDAAHSELMMVWHGLKGREDPRDESH